MQLQPQQQPPSNDGMGSKICLLRLLAAFGLLLGLSFMIVGCLSASGIILLGKSRYRSYAEELKRSTSSGKVMIGVSVIFFLVGMLPACVVCKLKQALRSSADNVGAAPCHQHEYARIHQPYLQYPHQAYPAVGFDQSQAHPPLRQPLPYPILPQLPVTPHQETVYKPIYTVEPHPPSYEEAVMEPNCPKTVA